MRKTYFRALLSGGLLGLTLTFPQQALETARQALSLFAVSVLPALLPFTACMLLFTAGRTLSLPPLILLSFLGGSPAGARLFQDAKLSLKQAKRIAAQTGVMSPMFFLGTLSLWLQNAHAARVLLCCHLLAALCTGLFFKSDGSRAKITLPPLSFGAALPQAAQAMLTAGACIVLGAVAARMLCCLFPAMSATSSVLLQGLMEVTSGAKQLLAFSFPLKMPLLSFLLSFSGVSILLQNAVFWEKQGVSLSFLMICGLLRGIIAFILCTAIILYYPAMFAV